MSHVSILRMLPLVAIVSPLLTIVTNAAESSQTSILAVTLGEKYSGKLTPSPTNPQGEVCYQLAIKPDTKITLRAKTIGMGILKFAVYDKTKALQFFHNTANNYTSGEEDLPMDAGFSFPTKTPGSQLCLTTNNPQTGQQYEFTITGKSNRGIRARHPRPKSAPEVIAAQNPGKAATAPAAVVPQPTIETDASPTVKMSPPPMGRGGFAMVNMPLPQPITPAPVILAPTGSDPAKTSNIAVAPAPATTKIAPKYCYAGTWQISDLSPYWQPILQNFTQAKVTDPRMLGYGKIIITQDGKSLFEAIDLEQKYTLKSPETGDKIDNLEFTIAGRATAKFQENPDNTLTFNSQSYHRLTSKLNLGSSLKLNGDRLFTIFGDGQSAQIPLPYQCLDGDNMILKIPLPVGKQLVPIALKRIN